MVDSHTTPFHPRGSGVTNIAVCALMCMAAVFAAQEAAADSFGDLFKRGETALINSTGFFAILFYIVGAITTVAGLTSLARAWKYPQQSGYGPPLMTIVIGVALIAFPGIVNAIADVFTGTGSSNITRPKL